MNDTRPRHEVERQEGDSTEVTRVFHRNYSKIVIILLILPVRAASPPRPRELICPNVLIQFIFAPAPRPALDVHETPLDDLIHFRFKARRSGGSAWLRLLESPTEWVEVFGVDDRSLAADWPDSHHRARHHVLDR